MAASADDNDVSQLLACGDALTDEAEQEGRAQVPHLWENDQGIAEHVVQHAVCPADNLPFELLQMIFGFVLPPSEFLEPSLHGGPDSPWSRSIRMKKDLTLVCVAWHPVGMIFLYEQVAFCHAGQVVAFARTLRSGVKGVYPLVKKLVLDCYVPKRLWDVVMADIAFILTECRSITSLTITPIFLSSDRFAPVIYSLPFPQAIAIFGPVENTSSIEPLLPDTSTTITSPSSIPSFALCSRLVSLTMPSYLSAPSQVIDWPCLEELDVSPCDFSPQRPEPSLYDLNHFIEWRMPRLKRIHVSLTSLHHNEFFKRHGSNLLGLCPRLEHLVVTPESRGLRSCLDAIPPHPRLMFVDIWDSDPYDDDDDPEDNQELVLDTFYASRKIFARKLDYALVHIRDLPRLLPPDTPASELATVHELCGLYVLQTDVGVFRCENMWGFGSEPEYGSESEPESESDGAKEYRPGSSSSESDDDLSDWTEEEEFSDDSQLDPQAALDIYSETMDVDSDYSDDTHEEEVQGAEDS
ncbi:hypothetical protein A0H81_06351 [Grifola frondosa]|uniref:F-box domain-containing protein n=1 Tax=Grifola frondosa TaxID=5627 RepID=A0A1C7M9W7_GRIFR|nr:hypothetical protein A0H81_06351 [Grifola frondosa]